MVQVTITAAFAEPLVDIAPGEMGIAFAITAGGTGEKFVVGTINRLVPREAVTIFFATKPPAPGVTQRSFIQGITFKGGQGQTGEPWIHTLRGLLLGFVLPVGAVGLLFYGFMGVMRKHMLETDEEFREAAQLGLSAAQEGLSDEQFQARVQERYGRMRFKRKLLTKMAQAAFTAAKPSPTVVVPSV